MKKYPRYGRKARRNQADETRAKEEINKRLWGPVR